MNGFIQSETVVSMATISKCGKYRYRLSRHWDCSKPQMTMVGLNPSKADHRINDQTINKIMLIAKNLGFGGFVMLNVFAFREANSKCLRMVVDPVGPDNDQTLLNESRWSKLENPEDRIVVAWGRKTKFPKKYIDRDKEVLKILEKHKIYCFGKNGDGSPKHPLFLSSKVQLEEY